jgi:hypothetical protein
VIRALAAAAVGVAVMALGAPVGVGPAAAVPTRGCRPALARTRDLPRLDRLSLSHRQMEIAKPVRQIPIRDAAARARVGEQLAAARRFAASVHRVRDVRRQGYVLTLPPERGSGAHWTRWDLVNCHFDPARPSEVLTDGAGGDARVVALSYLVVHRGGPPKGFADPNARWHRHFGLCVVHGALVDRDRCRRRGRLLDGRDLWMLHAWVVPGWSNPWGTFAPLNPNRLEPGVAAEAHADHR